MMFCTQGLSNVVYLHAILAQIKLAKKYVKKKSFTVFVFIYYLFIYGVLFFFFKCVSSIAKIVEHHPFCFTIKSFKVYTFDNLTF